MSDNKKYYYLRLKDNFFDSDELKVLESMKDGYLYSNILLKLYLRSLKNDGKLVFNDRIPYSAEMLSSITCHQVGTIKQALSIFKDLGLIDILDNGAIYMLDIQNFIGKGSSEADRKREYRQRIECDRTNVRTNLRQISTRDRDRDRDRNRDRDRDICVVEKPQQTHTYFKPPTVEEVKEYCIERNNNIDAEYFVDFQEARGWVLSNGKKMKDWKATIRTWERNNYNRKPVNKNSKEDAINVVNNLMDKLGGGSNEQSTTDSESTIDVTASVHY